MLDLPKPFRVEQPKNSEPFCLFSVRQMCEHAARARTEALTEAYEALFSIKGCKVTLFDAQTAIRSLDKEVGNV